MSGEILVIVSCAEGEAELIAKSVIENKLAACVSILPSVKSVYTWQEKFCQEQESLLFIKSSQGCWKALEKQIKSLHSYEVPEIIALPIQAGHQPYLDWLNKSLGKNLLDQTVKSRD